MKTSGQNHLVEPTLSKTRQKKDMHQLQRLGEALVELSAERLKKLDLPETLFEAIVEAQRLNGKREALRRQLQYIGRLMRDVDAEPLSEQLALINGESAEATARLHQIEKLRERLLEDENVLGEIMAADPTADDTRLRQLRRGALKEKALGQPPKHYRALFQALKTLTFFSNQPGNEHEHSE